MSVIIIHLLSTELVQLFLYMHISVISNCGDKCRPLIFL